jgi:hypothetical protein
MTDTVKEKFVSMLRGKRSLTGAGVILIEGSSSQVLRQPNMRSHRMYVVLYQLSLTNLYWSGPSWRRNTELQLFKLGVRLMDMALSCVVFDRYACFVGLGESTSGAVLPGADPREQLFQATKDMQEMQMSFNLQYLNLQNQIQHENRQFTMLSNIMKTKHDTVKNSISNVR